MPSADPPQVYKLHLLGTLSLHAEEGHSVHSVLVQPKRLALLVYLALARPWGFHRRDVMIAMLWPELDARHARNSLSQALSYIRRSLGENTFQVRGTEEVGLAPGKLHCDLLELEAALQAGDHHRALSLYQGELLPGFHLADAPEFDRWLEAQRSRLRYQIVEAALALSAAAQAAGDLHRALWFGQRAMELSPFEESALRRVLTLLDIMGDRAGAVTAYEAFARRLAGELEVDPAPETKQLMERIRDRSETQSRLLHTEADEPRRGAAAALDPPSIQPPGANTIWTISRTRRGDRLGRHVIATLGVLLTLFLALGAAGRFGLNRVAGSPVDPGTVARPPQRPIRSVAVLPFTNLSPDPDNAYFSDGIAEEVLNALGRIPGLRVPARTSAFRFRGREIDVQDAAAQLGVETIVEGSVRREGRHVRVSARLIDARSGYQLWTRTFDHELKDIFAIQEEIAREIVRVLRVEIGVAGDARMSAHRTTHDEAYHNYLIGRHLLEQRTPEAIRGAIDRFERAIGSDPGYALGYSGLADGLVLSVSSSVSDDQSQPGALARATEAAERAMTLDRDLAEVRASHAALLQRQGRWSEAEVEFRRAIELQPNYTSTHHRYAGLLFRMGRLAEAVVTSRQAVAVDPLSAVAHNRLGLYLYHQRNYDEAVQELETAFALNPRDIATRDNLAKAYVAVGRYRDARSMSEQTLALERNPSTLATLADVYLRTGEHRKARQVLLQLETAPMQLAESQRALRVAQVYAQFGELDHAFHWLGRVDFADAVNLQNLRGEPRLDPIRADPRYAALLRKWTVR